MGLRLAQGHYFGEALRRADAGGLTLIESHYAPGLVATRHTHDHACFCIVVDGGFSETYGRAERTCKSGSIIYRPAGEEHANEFVHGAHCLNIELSEACMARLHEYAPPAMASVDLSETPVREIAARMYRELQTADDLAPLAIEGLAIEALAHLSRRLRRTHTAPTWLARVRELVHERQATPSLAEIAAEVGVHPVHLARSFRQHHGCTIGAYARRLRIEKACRLLATTTLPLVQIAIDVGFSHQSHFTTAFKRAIGMTPSEYRQR